MEPKDEGQASQEENQSEFGAAQEYADLAAPTELRHSYDFANESHKVAEPSRRSDSTLSSRASRHAELDAFEARLRSDEERAKARSRVGTEPGRQEQLAAEATADAADTDPTAATTETAPSAEYVAALERVSDERFEKGRQEYLDRSEQLGRQIPEGISMTYLSYLDAPLLPEERASNLEQAHSESSRKYAEALAELFDTDGEAAVVERARTLRHIALTALVDRELPVSSYGGSLSWALWDMGKQRYFSEHRDEADPRYEIGDPMTSLEVQADIINRQIGWETYGHLHHYPELAARLPTDSPITAQVMEYVNRPPKANGTLSSKELAELGALIQQLPLPEVTLENPEDADRDDDDGAEAEGA